MSGNAREQSESNGQVYVVHWPAAGFVKVGFSVDDRRWRAYLRRGGELVSLIEPTDRHGSVVEEDIHADMRATGMRPAFATKADAVPHLGHKGAGWTECYATEGDVLAQLIAIEELAARRRGA